MKENNPYLPVPVRLKKKYIESDDKLLRTFDLEFVNESDVFDYLPGQFCQLSILGKGEAAFGIASSPTEKGFIRFTVNKVGLLSSALHNLFEGDVIGLRGPLGNHYPLENMKGKNVLIIGGGFAITTLRSLALYLLNNKNDYKDISFLYGAKNPGSMIYRNEFEEWEKSKDMNVYLTIDKQVESWDKNVGFVPEVLKKVSPTSENTLAIVCGPPIMIKNTLPVLKELGFSSENIYTSLERRMKCGVGKCGRCNIGSKYVCIDGPVFSYSELEKIGEDIY